MVPLLSSSTEWWIFPLCSETVTYSVQLWSDARCPFDRCRSWTRLLFARCLYAGMHSASCAADHGDLTGPVFGSAVDAPVVVQRQCWVRMLGSTVDTYSVSVQGGRYQNFSYFLREGGTLEIPQRSFGLVVDIPVGVQTTGLWSDSGENCGSAIAVLRSSSTS